MKINAMTVLLFLLASSSFVGAEVYTWEDEYGVVHYGDRAPDPEESADFQEIQIVTYNDVTFGETIGPAHAPEGKLVMYSTTWCGACKRARSYFASNNIKYTDYDIEYNPIAKKRYNQLGANGVPVIFYGKKRMNGFGEEKFAQFYNMNNRSLDNLVAGVASEITGETGDALSKSIGKLEKKNDLVEKLKAFLEKLLN